MAKMTAQQVADKWASNAGNAEAAYKAGIQAVQVSPMEMAAQQQDFWFEQLRKAKESGAYVDGLRSASFSDWKRKTADVGSGRFRTGVADAKPKMQQFMADFLPYVQQVSDTVQAMPKNTEQQRDDRMLANVKALRKYSYKGRKA